MASIINQINQSYTKRHQKGRRACEGRRMLGCETTGGDDPVSGLDSDRNKARADRRSLTQSGGSGLPVKSTEFRVYRLVTGRDGYRRVSLLAGRNMWSLVKGDGHFPPMSGWSQTNNKTSLLKTQSFSRCSRDPPTCGSILSGGG